MRKKLLSKTYLRDVSEYIIEFSFTNDDYYLVKKKIIKTDPFILSNGLKVIDNNYYIIEILPKNENYAIRAYLDSEKNLIEHYIDITNGCGIDLDSKIPYYDDLYLQGFSTSMPEEVQEKMDEDDPLYNDILEFAVKTGKISASLIQRKYHLGYNRAARIIDIMEERNIIGPQNGSKPREVLVRLESKEED